MNAVLRWFWHRLPGNQLEDAAESLVNRYRHGYGVRVTIGTGTILAALVYGGIVWMMIAHMVKNFDQTVRRLSGTGQAESGSRKVERCSGTVPSTDQRA
jgi:hypothetical protein